MKGIILAALSLVVSLLIGLAIYLGAFKSVQLAQESAGPFKLIYKKHFGAYHKIVPVIEEVEKWARANGESCRLSFGEYIDNVDTVAEDRLQSHGGCILEKAWMESLPQDFLYREIPARTYLIAEFEGAPSIGPMKVYPRAMDYIKEHRLSLDGAVIEIYEIVTVDGKSHVKTRYHFPVKIETAASSAN